MGMIQACGVVLYQGTAGSEKFLLLRNRKHGTWGFPKGHLEKGEMPIETASREVEEETGFRKFDLNQSFRQTITYTIPDGKETREKHVTYFLGRVREKNPTLPEEHDRSMWASSDEAERVLQHENLRGVLRAALQHLRETTMKS